MEHGAELDGLITANAGVGRTASPVFGAEIVQHVLLVFLDYGNHVEGNGQALGHLLGGFDAFPFVGAKTSGATLYDGHVDGSVPKGHGNADDVIALLL